MDRDVRLRWLILAICVLVPSSAWSAAPFVHGEPPRLSVQIAESRAAVIVRRAPEPDASVWLVEKVLKDSTDSVKVGQRIDPRPAPTGTTNLALVVSHANRIVTATALTPRAASYLRDLSLPDGKKHLKFALEHLADADPFVAADAFAELAAFDRKTLESFSQDLSADVFRKLIDDPRTIGERLGLYGYLLGLCGDESDAERLRRRFLSTEAFTGGADGLAAGYLLIAGEPGLATLETDVFSSNEQSPLRAAALLEAFRFFRERDKSPFSRERLTQAACCGFNRPETADLAVGYLVEAREWSAMPRVIELLDARDDDADRKRAVQVIGVRFLLECRRDTDTTAANRAIASKALSHIGVQDPDLLRRAMHLAGEVPAIR